ncbi:hypothetical protein BD780_001943 [Clostridium tetanomorphum]|uniref:Uncharacterized protein n=1 Tax=Clostridium tetanomorphum TaxID=1553 RepID=A0A923ED18_CLOTT
MVKKNQKLPHAQAFKKAKKMMDNDKDLSNVIQETSLNHSDILKIKNENR